MDKSSLRKIIYQQRLTLSSSDIKTHSAKITHYLLQLKPFHLSQHIACYLPIHNEVDLTPFIEKAWQQNKNIYLPVIENQLMTFHLYQKNDSLIKNSFGILEPNRKNPLIPLIDLDFVLLPLIAFDQSGHRLGYGGGYYDRAFHFLHHQNPRKKPLLIGVAYSFQQTDELIDKNDWDVSLNIVVTEKGEFEFKTLT